MKDYKKKYIIDYIDKYNLWIRNIKTKIKTQLTFDGKRTMVIQLIMQGGQNQMDLY